MLSDAIIDPLPPQSIYQVVNPTPAKIQRTSAIWASALANYFTLAKLNLELISNIGRHQCLGCYPNDITALTPLEYSHLQGRQSEQ